MRAPWQWLLMGLILAGCERETPVNERTSPLPSQAFVWQRAWKPEVSAAVRDAAPLTALHVLAAEMTFQRDQAKTIMVEPDWPALQNYRGKVGAVLRIHASAAKTGWNENALRAVVEVCTQTLQRFAAAQTVPVELQIDYDCPESKLADYLRLVRHLKAAHPGVPVCITALPTWLKQQALRDLVAESPGWVLQVHSLQLPRAGGGGGTLMDLAQARRVVQQAAALGVPFRVALPTYSCVVEFHADGSVKEVYGEDLPPGVLIGARHIQVLNSDAYALAGLIQDWRQHAPDLMQAVIWYRLPVATDRLNWPASTLQKIVQGQTLKRGWKGGVKLGADGQTELLLQNEGDAPEPLPDSVVVEWLGREPEAADGLQGYTVAGQGAGWLRLRFSMAGAQAAVWPGQERVAGWVRLAPSSGSMHIKILP